MAANSKREQLILSDVAILEALTVIKTTKRTVQSYSDLQTFANTQLPVAAVVGGLPVTDDHLSGRRPRVDYIVSDLKIDIHVYIQANENQDMQVSDMLDDLWAALYANPNRNGLCMLTQLAATANYEYWSPYVAFKLSCIHKYQHTTEGI